MKVHKSPISAKKTTSRIMLGCYILCSESGVEVDQMALKGRGGSTTSRRSRKSTGKIRS
jgi:hypothetical protein